MINATNATQPFARLCARRLDSSCIGFWRISGKHHVERYVDIIEQVGSHFLWLSTLDVLQRPAESQVHFEYLMDHLSPRFRDKVLWIYQGGSLSELEDIARLRGFVGIGGMAAYETTGRVGRPSVPAAYWRTPCGSWCSSTCLWARKPGSALSPALRAVVCLNV
jgi:hypothetical protein